MYELFEIALRVTAIAVVCVLVLGLGYWASLIFETHDDWVFGQDAMDRVVNDDE